MKIRRCLLLTLVIAIAAPARPRYQSPADNIDTARKWIADGNYPAAEAKLLATLQEPENEALASSDLGGLYQLLGDTLRAERYYLRAVRIWEAAKPQPLVYLIRTWNNLASVYLNAGQPAKAERTCLRAAAAIERFPQVDPPDRARLLINQGGVYAAHRQYAEAETAFHRALALWQQFAGPDSPDAAAILNDLGALESSRSRWPDAIPHLVQAIAMWRRVSTLEFQLLTPLTRLGVAYTNAGRYAEAEDTLEQARKIAEVAVAICEPYEPGLLSARAALLRKTHRRREAARLEAQSATLLHSLELRGMGRNTVDIGDLVPRGAASRR